MESEQERAVAFGKALRQERTSVRMTQQELAEMVGYGDKSAISKLEAGKTARPPSRERIEMIAEALDVPPGRLLRAAGYEWQGPAIGGSELEEIQSLLNKAQRLLDDLSR